MKNYRHTDTTNTYPASSDGTHLKKLPSRWFRILLNRLTDLTVGRLTLVLPKGEEWTVGEGEPHATLRLHSYVPIRRCLNGGNLGFAEGYMNGEWDSPNLTALFELAVRNETTFSIDNIATRLKLMLRRYFHRRHTNSRHGSQRNIAYHYDLGNKFFGHWLDDSMTYSSAWFDDTTQSLEAAQQLKYRQIADLAELAPGQSVLEIGCGWGGFSEFAARNFGVQIRGLTLSHKQISYAQARYAKAGILDQSQAVFSDYRDETGSYDRIVSIEMLEAVGENNWDTYFCVIRNRLRPGGIAVLQAITVNEKRYKTYHNDPDFIQVYIFPGGMLPCYSAIEAAVERNGLKMKFEQSFGSSYAKTLRHWQRRFQRAWPDIAATGFDLRFKRMWEYYLCYCEAAFNTGATDVHHFKIQRPAHNMSN